MVQAHHEALTRDRDRSVTAAWLSAALQRQRRVTPLKRLLNPVKKRPRLDPEWKARMDRRVREARHG